MNIKSKLGILCVAALALLAAACHSGGGSGDASSVVGSDPYAGTWTGYMRVPSTGPTIDLSISLNSVGRQQYEGTAEKTVEGTKVTGTASASYSTVGTTHITILINWDSSDGRIVLEGDIKDQTSNYFISGTVQQVGSDGSGVFTLSKNK